MRVTSTPPDPASPQDAPPPPRDPRQVRFWGWVAFAVAIVIVVVGLLVGRPWRVCHCPLHKGSLPVPVVVTRPGPR